MWGTSGQVLVFNKNDDHNQCLHRNRWCGVTPLAEKSQVTNHIRCALGWPNGRRRLIATVTTACIPDVDIVISYGQVKSRLSSHLLCPITPPKQASYGKKSLRSCSSTFCHSRPALASYVVPDGSNWLESTWVCWERTDHTTCAKTYVQVYAYTKS